MKVKKVVLQERYKKGFTLAEVLVTLAIIGIVASLTIPAVFSSYRERYTVSALKKFYSRMELAFNLAIADNGNIEAWDWSTSSKIYNIISPKLKRIKNCKDETVSNKCFAEKYHYLNGTVVDYNATNVSDARAAGRLADGSTFSLGTLGTPGCSTSVGQGKFLSNVCGHLIVDINGDKTPNINGVDLFEFWITKYGVIPKGTQNETVATYGSTLQKSCTNKTKSGTGCAGWVIAKENMDYLRKDISW